MKKNWQQIVIHSHVLWWSRWNRNEKTLLRNSAPRTTKKPHLINLTQRKRENSHTVSEKEKTKSPFFCFGVAIKSRIPDEAKPINPIYKISSNCIGNRIFTRKKNWRTEIDIEPLYFAIVSVTPVRKCVIILFNFVIKNMKREMKNVCWSKWRIGSKDANASVKKWIKTEQNKWNPFIIINLRRKWLLFFFSLVILLSNWIGMWLMNDAINSKLRNPRCFVQVLASLKKKKKLVRIVPINAIHAFIFLIEHRVGKPIANTDWLFVVIVATSHHTPSVNFQSN